MTVGATSHPERPSSSFGMDEQENPLEKDHVLSVVLPGGLEKNATVHGSTPVMDFLVTLCGSNHLNLSDFTVEFLSPNKNNISFKPNSPIGSLEAEKIVLKPKGVEEKIKRPYMPEATVRLLVNYKKSHKAVVRVNPGVPLEKLLPVVCDKCEFEVETTVLLRDNHSKEPLDITKTLNEYGLREVYAKDTADRLRQPQTPERAVTPSVVISPPPLPDLPKKKKKRKENMGFLSLFRRRKNKPEMDGAASAPTSPGFNKQTSSSTNALDASSYILPADVPKKRRAPQPPMGASVSVPNNLSTCHLKGAQHSAESTLGRTKRRAPLPPCVSADQELQADAPAKVESLNTLDDLRESDESDSVNIWPSSSSSPRPSQPPSSSSSSSSSSSRPSLAHLREVAEPYLPTCHAKDLTDARCALARVLTSSISNGTLVKRLRNTNFPKLYNGSSSASQRSRDDEGFGAELESVLNSNLPTENDWEDPVQRKGLTTFKVVPSNITTSNDPEIPPASPETSSKQTQIEVEPHSEPLSEETEPPHRLPPSHGCQDDPGSPRSEAGDVKLDTGQEEPEDATTGVPSDCADEELPGDEQSESPQIIGSESPGPHMDRCGSCTDEKEPEEDVPPEEESFPPPPPPVYYNDEGVEAPEAGEETSASTPKCSRPPSPASNSPNLQTDASPEGVQTGPASAEPEQSSGDDVSSAPSLFAQAVALALQRRTKGSVPEGPSGPNGSLSSTPRSTYQYDVPKGMQRRRESSFILSV